MRWEGIGCEQRLIGIWHSGRNCIGWAKVLIGWAKVMIGFGVADDENDTVEETILALRND